MSIHTIKNNSRIIKFILLLAILAIVAMKMYFVSATIMISKRIVDLEKNKTTLNQSLLNTLNEDETALEESESKKVSHIVTISLNPTISLSNR